MAGKQTRSLINETKELIAKLICECVKEGGHDISHLEKDIFNSLQKPIRREHGELALASFVYAKSIKANPMSAALQVATQLTQRLQDPRLGNVVSKIELTGPYINFFLTTSCLARIVPQVNEGKYLAPLSDQGQERVMIEYSQPNTHKSFHVGHMRNAALGHSLVKLYEQMGHKVTAANYFGDEGAHIAKCLWQLQRHVNFTGLDINNILERARGEFLGDMYSQAVEELSLDALTSLPYAAIIAAKVLKKEKFTDFLPQAKQDESKAAPSNWHVVTVDTGSGEAIVVCGGIAYEVGDNVAYVPVGNKFNGKSIAAKDMMGVMSHGLIVAKKEVELTDQAEAAVAEDILAALGKSKRDLDESIWVLPAQTPLGVLSQCVDVLVTQFGDTFHMSDCRYSHSSATPQPLTDALNKRKTACPKCAGCFKDSNLPGVTAAKVAKKEKHGDGNAHVVTLDTGAIVYCDGTGYQVGDVVAYVPVGQLFNGKAVVEETVNGVKSAGMILLKKKFQTADQISFQIAKRYGGVVSTKGADTNKDKDNKDKDNKSKDNKDNKKPTNDNKTSQGGAQGDAKKGGAQGGQGGDAKKGGAQGAQGDAKKGGAQGGQGGDAKKGGAQGAQGDAKKGGAQGAQGDTKKGGAQGGAAGDAKKGAKPDGKQNDNFIWILPAVVPVGTRLTELGKLVVVGNTNDLFHAPGCLELTYPAWVTLPEALENKRKPCTACCDHSLVIVDQKSFHLPGCQAARSSDAPISLSLALTQNILPAKCCNPMVALVPLESSFHMLDCLSLSHLQHTITLTEAVTQKKQACEKCSVDLKNVKCCEWANGNTVETEWAKRKKEAADMLIAMEVKTDPEITALWDQTKKWSLDAFRGIYSWLDVRFDCEFFESEVGEESVKMVKEFHQKGVLVNSDGAIGADLNKFNMGFCVLLKSNGSGLYATKDLSLATRKFNEYNIEKSIYVVDAAQTLHFKQVFKTLELFGYEKAKQCIHLPYGLVVLPHGKMSSRQGTVIVFSKLTRLLNDEILSKYLERHVSGDKAWTTDEIEEAQRKLAVATIKYGMLNHDTAKDIVFDMNDWVSNTGNTGPYMMYAYARIRSIIREVPRAPGAKVDFSLLTYERPLLTLMHEYWDVVAFCTERNNPSSLCDYLFELAKAFSAWYENKANSVKKAKPDIQATRLEFILALSEVIKSGLSLLGIDCLERM